MKTAGGAEASQTTTVMFALATELGAPYLPEGSPKQIKAMQLMCDAADLMSESSKFGEKPERATKWFTHIDAMLAHELCSGESATCADFTLWQTLDLINAKAPALLEGHPNVQAFMTKMEATKGVKAVKAMGMPRMPPGM